MRNGIPIKRWHICGFRPKNWQCKQVPFSWPSGHGSLWPSLWLEVNSQNRCNLRKWELGFLEKGKRLAGGEFWVQRPKKGQCKTSPHSTGKEHSKLQTLKAARISGLWPKGQKNASVNRTAFNWTRALETLLTLIVNSRKKMPRQRMRNGAPGNCGWPISGLWPKGPKNMPV